MISCIIDEKTVKNIIEKRRREIHKGDCGRVLIIAGSKGMTGAGRLCASGALRAGAGLVRISLPEELFPIMQVGIPEATCIDRSFSKEDLKDYDSIAIGPGLGANKETRELVKKVITLYEGPLVLDADALNIVAKDNLFMLLKQRKGATVITPHVGEALRLLEEKKEVFEDITEEKTRIELALRLREKTGAIVVLKGAGTIVATDEDKTYTNTTGNPGMATGGSGDVLCGIIAGLIAQKKQSGARLSPGEGAVAGVYIHGSAGDLASQRYGEYGLIAGDIALYTAFAIKEILK